MNELKMIGIIMNPPFMARSITDSAASEGAAVFVTICAKSIVQKIIWSIKIKNQTGTISPNFS